MEIKNNNKFKTFFKRFGAIGLAGVFSVAIALTIGLTATHPEEQQPVSTGAMVFELPMTNAVVVKDYAEDRLQHNESLKRWEAHLAIDLASENASVFSIYDGVVASVETNSLQGTVVTINHEDGFVSVYGSLADELMVNVGDAVVSGQEIGRASTSATNEIHSGAHLHFTLLKDGETVDPNNYLDLQNK